MSDLRSSPRLPVSVLAAVAALFGLLAFGAPEAGESPGSPPSAENGEVDVAVFAVG